MFKKTLQQKKKTQPKRSIHFNIRDLAPVKTSLNKEDENITGDIGFVCAYMTDTLFRIFISMILVLTVLLEIIKMLLRFKDGSKEDDNEQVETVEIRDDKTK